MKRSIWSTCVHSMAAVALAMMLHGCDSTSSTSPDVRPDADSLAMSPDSASVAVGTTFRFTVVAYDSLGRVINANLRFASSDSAVFTVDGTGRVRGENPGVATLTVTSGAARDSAIVIVTPAIRGWYAQSSGVTGVALHGVFFRPSGSRGWVVGDGGRILRTLDGGAEWTLQPSGTALALNDTWFTSDLEGWAAGNSGTVLRTINGGTSWTRLLNTGTGENLYAVQFVNRDTGWVVGSNGVILRTIDRGGSWQRVNPSSFDLHGVSFSGASDGWAVGDNGVILGTRNSGQSWYTVVPSVTTAGLRDVWRASVSRANAVGAAGAAPRTIAAADSASWLLDNVGGGYELHGVCFPTATVGFAVGAGGGGAVLRSDDGGDSWLPQLANTAFPLEDVFFVDTLRGWAVGANGTIVHTVTGGLP